ncbi:MAG TPA: hypothetical protein VIC83_01295 [Candidatus Limnocylindria bacterium]
MLRRLTPAAVLLTAAVAACGGPTTPAINDPVEIISQGMEATADATSFHMDLTLAGNVTIPESGGSFNLEGTTASGDFDVENEEGRLTFEVPALFDLSGEVLQIGTDSYVKSSLTGDTYSKTTTETGELPADPSSAFAEIRDFLDDEGVETEKLADVNCGDRTCYAVRLTIPTEALPDGLQAFGVDVGDMLGDGLVLDLQFDRETLQLTQVSTDLDAGELGTFGLLVTFSGYGETVDVSPPPSDQVTEGAPALPF